MTGHNTKQLHIIKLPEELQPVLSLKPRTQSTPGLSLSTMSWIYSFLIETTLVGIFIVRPFLWSPLQVIWAAVTLLWLPLFCFSFMQVCSWCLLWIIIIFFLIYWACLHSHIHVTSSQESQRGLQLWTWSNSPPSLNSGHNPEAQKMPVPVSGSPNSDLPRTTHLIIKISLELPPSSKRWAHLDNPYHHTSKDGLMFN